MTRQLFALILGIAAAGPALSASGDGQFKIDGPGAAPCAEFTAAMTGSERAKIAGFAGWVEGFLTGVNAFRPETYDITPWQTTPLVMEKLRKFCLDHPDVQMIDATGRLVSVLVPDRQTAQSPIVQTRNGGHAVTLPAMILERVRQAVETDRAVALGTAPGGFDAEFSAALAAYQTARGLDATGLPDQMTLNAMFP